MVSRSGRAKHGLLECIIEIGMEVEFLKKIVQEAEEISRRNFEVHEKGDEGDLVTNLDVEIERFLIARIKEEYPDYAIVSEESNADKTVTDNCFIIDPIDGTINFANGLPLWGTQIACCKNGKTVASVINLPKIGEFYYADETGAYLNGQKITVREVPVKNAIYAMIGHGVIGAAEKAQRYSRNYREFGATCVALAFLASGKIHGVSFMIDQPWDYVPGLFLCKKAGAKVESIDGFHAGAMNQEFLDILKDCC